VQATYSPRRVGNDAHALDLLSEAIARVERAAARAKDQGAVVLEWRAVTGLARLLEEAGRPDEARERLRAICGAADGLDSPELDEARRLLAVMQTCGEAGYMASCHEEGTRNG